MRASSTSVRSRRTGRCTATGASGRCSTSSAPRALARLVLLPRDDPQFRRNKERVNRDAERELISLEWELGIPADDDTDTDTEE